MGGSPPHRGAILIVGPPSAIDNYPSGRATDGYEVSTSGAAESLRDSLAPTEKGFI